MWPGWGVWGQRVVTEYCVWGRGGCWTLRPERVHRRSSPRRPALTPVPYWRACPLEAEPRAAPPTRARGLGGLSSQQGPPAPRCLRAGPAAPLGCGSALQPPAPPRCRQGNWAGGRSGRRRQAAYPRLPPSTQSSPSLRPPPLLQLLPLQPEPRLPPEETHRPDPRRCNPPPTPSRSP